jgi:hypothetical protein
MDRREEMIHRIDNNEMDPHTECGIEMVVGGGIELALAHEDPTCKECLIKEEHNMQQAINTIKISGKTYFGCDNPEEYMKDMLRHDGGVIFNLDVTDEATHTFEATIVASDYTPERWMTFGLYPTLINGTNKAWKAEHQITHLK